MTEQLHGGTGWRSSPRSASLARLCYGGQGRRPCVPYVTPLPSRRPPGASRLHRTGRQCCRLDALGARAQALPVIGYLGSESPELYASRLKPSARDWRTRATPKGARSPSSTGGPTASTAGCRRWPRNSPASRSPSSWRRAAPRSRWRQRLRRRRSRSCSRWAAIPWRSASWRACRGPAAISPACRASASRSRASGWSSCARYGRPPAALPSPSIRGARPRTRS